MRLTFILVLAATWSLAQTPAQQKALNSYADFANQSADEMAAVVMSIIQYYPTINLKSSRGVPRYTCPVQLEEYYHKTALVESKNLPPAIAAALTKKLNEVQAAAEAVDARCKALDTYHKLEDYKKDNFAQAQKLITELQSLVGDYRTKQNLLAIELENATGKLNPNAEQSPYGKADAILKKQIARERTFLDSWTFNLNEAIPTGWPVDKLEQSIAETAEALAMIRKQQPALKYPASSMWSNFQESLANVLAAKRHALDEYNNEARKSDRHANDTYLGLINYFNGTLVSDQNAFIQYASNDGYRGIKSIRYFPLFEIRSQAVTQSALVKPFADHPRTVLNPPAQKAALTKPAYMALVNYVEFINQTGRQTAYLSHPLAGLSSYASGYDKTDRYGRYGKLHFDYKDYQLPLSQFQKTISESAQLPPAFAGPLNQQAEVLLNILKELDAISATLELEAGDDKYDDRRSARVFSLLDRAKVLMETWDDRKEKLYEDVRRLFDAYPPAQPSSPWYVSGKALQNLTDLSHDGLFKAKAFYIGGQLGSRESVPTVAIDEAVREVISREYENMKGIEKIGRNNGLCPYTPYEDLPIAAKRLSEALNPLNVGNGRGYQHPYYKVLYQYNDIVRYYNKFCELSKTAWLLPAIAQPQLFELNSPKPNDPQQKPVQTSTSSPPVGVAATGGAATTGAPKERVATNADASLPGGKVDDETRATAGQPASGPPNNHQQVEVRERIERDTVYIERRDTVYLGAPGENLRSMEGYAVNHMVLLLDVSGSMNAPEKLPILKASVLELISMMRSEDKVSIVAFSDKPKALLTAASFKEEGRIREAINALKSSGKTDGNAAVRLAYKLADENYLRGGNNRIILATDGEFFLNDASRALIQKFSTDDIFLSIFNFGKGAGASRALEQVARLGKGNYHYITRENVELELIREAKAKRAR